MSAILRNHEGVILDYGDPGELRAHHTGRRHQPSDLERMRLIKAECELLTLQIIAEHLDLSGIAMTRIADALETIRQALQVKRRKYGMQTDSQAAA